MREIEVNTSPKYAVTVGRGLLARAGELLAPHIREGAVIVCGENVLPLYGEGLLRSLREAGIGAKLCPIPGGERNKNAQTLVALLNTLAEMGATRADTLIALGGGVTGDLAGLAAALYQRGMGLVQVPTTLLAMVDSSVGGKTAVNLERGKNMMGVFCQPDAVLCDIGCLETLPPRIFAEGWAEIIKTACIADPTLCGETDVGAVVARCVAIKRDVVAGDEFDRGGRRILNFGHTVGHAVEKASGFTYLHGEAVAIGMSVITRGAEALGLCENGCAARIEMLLKQHELPIKTDIPVDIIIENAYSDKKRSGEKITLVLPRRFGECGIVETDLAFLRRITEAGM